jgi:hypothetical protein
VRAPIGAQRLLHPLLGPAARVREAYKAYWDAETDADFRRAKERVKKALRAYRRAHEGTRSRED